MARFLNLGSDCLDHYRENRIAMETGNFVRRFPGDTQGSTVVEAAIVLPVLFAMCLGLIETSRAMWMQNSLLDAVDAAARCSVVSASCSTATQTQTYAVQQIKGFKVTTSNFTATTETCGKRVKASVPFTSNTLGLGLVSFNLTAESCRPYTP